VEIEAKLEVLEPGEDDLSRLQAAMLEEGYAVALMPADLFITDTYADTPEHDLRKVGAAIRLRQKGGKRLFTYKRKVSQKDSVHTRVELEGPLTLELIEAIRQELGSAGISFPELDESGVEILRAEGLFEAWGLSERLEIRTRRKTCELRAEAEVVARLVYDVVNFSQGDRSGGYTGIEIEAAGAENEAVVGRLAEAVKAELGEGVREQRLSKYEAALEILGST
jgi:hypothetical protein